MGVASQIYAEELSIPVSEQPCITVKRHRLSLLDSQTCYPDPLRIPGVGSGALGTPVAVSGHDSHAQAHRQTGHPWLRGAMKLGASRKTGTLSVPGSRDCQLLLPSHDPSCIGDQTVKAGHVFPRRPAFGAFPSLLPLSTRPRCLFPDGILHLGNGLFCSFSSLLLILSSSRRCWSSAFFGCRPRWRWPSLSI